MPSEVLKPERARMYSLSRLAMIRISRGAGGRDEAAAGRTKRRSPVLTGAATGALAAGFAGSLAPGSGVAGAVRSSAQASRWCASGRGAPPPVSGQTASAVRERLQVETLQIQ